MRRTINGRTTWLWWDTLWQPTVSAAGPPVDRTKGDAGRSARRAPFDQGRPRRPAREGQVTLGVVKKHEQDGQILRAEEQIDRPAEVSREPAESPGVERVEAYPGSTDPPRLSGAETTSQVPF